jgi:ubiquinone/menaquinone biosynthesis C-methylase UbiE
VDLVQRVPEPELMDDEVQARAYAEADFSAPHDRFVELLHQRLGTLPPSGVALDLGCGPGDVTARVAHTLPAWQIDGIDGSTPMLRLGREAMTARGLDARVTLVEGHLPEAVPPRSTYDLVFSNSLLHHMRHAADFWQCVRRWRRPGAPVFIMDLLRPTSRVQADHLVDVYVAGEPEILRRDFQHSLCAAYRVDEVREQLRGIGLALEVETVSDRHWIAWSGR